MRAIYASPVPADDGSNRLVRRPISEVMSTPVLSVTVDALLGDALDTMVRYGRRHLVVVDGAGRCVGVLADRVVASAWAYNPAALSRHPVVAALDTTHPAVVGTNATVVDAARLMRTAGDDAVAVVDGDGRPVGIVTGTDLIALLAH